MSIALKQIECLLQIFESQQAPLPKEAIDAISRTNLIVYGYIRSRLIVTGYQNVLLTNKQIPPPLVGNLCVSYFETRDYFSSTEHGQYVTINEDQTRMSLNHKPKRGGTAYGVLDITNDLPFIYIWHVKVVHSEKDRDDKDHNTISIGIDASNRSCKEKKFHTSAYNKNHYYSLNKSGYIHRYPTADCSRTTISKRYIRSKANLIGENKVVRVELNIPMRTMKFYMDDIDLGVAFDDINFDDNRKYNFAVFAGGNVVIDMIDFEEIFVAP